MFSCSIVPDSATPWIVTCQAPLSMEFSTQEYWSGLPFPSPGDLPNPVLAKITGTFTWKVHLKPFSPFCTDSTKPFDNEKRPAPK